MLDLKVDKKTVNIRVIHLACWKKKQTSQSLLALSLNINLSHLIQASIHGGRIEARRYGELENMIFLSAGYIKK